ncbi:F-box domain-containing protein, partial [Favolaschia claudopus]
MSEAGDVVALRLPFELISMIFILCLPLRGRVRPHPHKVPLNLAGVCARWREAALGIPELWTSIFLELVRQTPPHVVALRPSCVALMDLWFTRAAGRRLSISITCAKHCLRLPGLLATMEAYRTQWGRVELEIPLHDILAFKQITGPFPSLSSLTLKPTDQSSPFRTSGLHTEVAVQSPRLKALQVPEFTFGNLGLPRLLPRNLTAVQLVYRGTTFPGVVAMGGVPMPPVLTITSSFLTPLLHHLPHLLHLDLTASNLPSGPSTPRLRASLITLRINEDQILESLDIPTLQHLHLTLTSRATLCDFIARSQCQLTSLSVEIPNSIDNNTLASVLSTTPELHTLVLCLILTTPFRLNAIQRCELLFDVSLVPRLRNLVVNERVTFPAYERWTDLLESRKSTGLIYAELYASPSPVGFPKQLVPPWVEIEARWESLAACGMQPRVIIGHYAWPWNAKDLDPGGDLDSGFIEPRKLRPY